MSIQNTMKEHDIPEQWVFTHAKLHDKEGLFFFEPLLEINEDTDEKQYSFDTKCLLIDGAKFTYTDDMEQEIELNVKDNSLIFSRFDGNEIKIQKEWIDNMPFKYSDFGTTVVDHSKPSEYIEIQ